MGKDKLKRFAENLTFKNLFQYLYEDLQNPDSFPLKGKWRTDYFKNDHPIIVEVGCGKGDYTTGLASMYPEKNFIGFDRQGARLWRGCRNAIENNLENVAFVRTNIQFIEHFFAPDEVDEIWVTFPDPQPSKPNHRKRLTSPTFLKRYSNILKPDGIMHLKTDSDFFFDFTLETIAEGKHEILFKSHDLYADEVKDDVSKIQTFYEKMWLEQGLKIKYVRFKINRATV